MRQIASLPVTVAADGAEPGRATWGQTYILDLVEELYPHDACLNLHLVAPIPDGAELSRVLTVTRRIIERHESFRTDLSHADRDGPLQRLVERISYPVDVWEHEPSGPDVDGLAADLRARPFPARTPPLFRWAVVLQRGTPRHLVLVASHLVVDGWSLALLSDELDRLFREDDQPAARVAELPPRDRARWEQSPEARRLSERSWAHQDRIADSGTPVRPTLAPRSAESPRYWSGDLRTAATFRRATSNAEALGVAVHSLFLAAFSTTLGRLVDTPAVTVSLQCANRFSEAERAAVGQFTQGVLVRSEVSAERDWSLRVRAVHGAALRAYGHGRYRPRMGSPSAVTRPDFLFNFFPARHPPSPNPAAGADRFSWGERRVRETFIVYGIVDEEQQLMRLLVDTTCFSSDQIVPTLENWAETVCTEIP